MRIVAALFALVVTATPAAATDEGPPPEQLFKEFGLFGKWAVDCAAPALPGNPHVYVRQPTPGVILEEHDLGPNNDINLYSVLSAERLSDTRLSAVVLLHPGRADEERQQLTFAVRDGTRRTLFNQVVGGPVRVKDGIAQWNGSKTPLLHKCE